MRTHTTTTRAGPNRSEPGAIDQEHANAPGAYLTVLSLAADTAGSDLHISYGPPSRHKYHRYRLEDDNRVSSEPRKM